MPIRCRGSSSQRPVPAGRWRGNLPARQHKARKPRNLPARMSALRTAGLLSILAVAVKGKTGRRKTGGASCSICTERRSSIFCWWVATRKATGCNGCRLSYRRPEFNSRRVCHWSSWRGTCNSARASSGTTLESRISPRRSACPDWCCGARRTRRSGARAATGSPSSPQTEGSPESLSAMSSPKCAGGFKERVGCLRGVRLLGLLRFFPQFVDPLVPLVHPPGVKTEVADKQRSDYRDSPQPGTVEIRTAWLHTIERVERLHVDRMQNHVS